MHIDYCASAGESSQHCMKFMAPVHGAFCILFFFKGVIQNHMSPPPFEMQKNPRGPPWWTTVCSHSVAGPELKLGLHPVCVNNL